MNLFFKKTLRHGQTRDGFSLVETALSLGILSFGFLSLISMMSLGLKTARQARDNQTSAQIAQTLVEEARQGMLASGILYLDLQGIACSSTDAAYTAQSKFQSLSSGPASATGAAFLTRLTLQITPVGAPDRARIYAVVYPALP